MNKHDLFIWDEQSLGSHFEFFSGKSQEFDGFKGKEKK